MAKYDRRILVPHLQDICWVEMEYHKMIQLAADSRNRCEVAHDELTKAEKLSKPLPPQKSDYVKHELGGPICFIVLAAVLFVVLVASTSGFFRWVIIVLGGFFLAGILASLLDQVRLNGMDMEKYNEREKMYLEAVENYNKTKESIPVLQEQENSLHLQYKKDKEQLTQISSLREKLYSVNIIPNKYRNLHAAYYLYDYFCSSQEDDLDGIIKTMLLDDIVQQLDVIIQQQRQVILNQRRQIAIQESGNEQLAERHAEQMRAIATMEGNQLQQQKYLQMIDDRIRVNNYFTKGTYKQEKAWIESL